MLKSQLIISEQIQSKPDSGHQAFSRGDPGKEQREGFSGREGSQGGVEVPKIPLRASHRALQNYGYDESIF